MVKYQYNNSWEEIQVSMYLRRTEQFPPCCSRRAGLEVSACSHCSCHSQQDHCASAPSPFHYGLTWTLVQTDGRTRDHIICINVTWCSKYSKRNSTQKQQQHLCFLCQSVMLTLYVSMSHIFTVLGKGILEILGCFQLNECLSTRTPFFRVGETHSVYFPHDVTVWK